MANKQVKKVLKELGNWGKHLEFPMKQSVLEDSWSEQASRLLQEIQVPDETFEEVFSLIKDANLLTLTDQNISEVQNRLQVLVDEHVMRSDFTVFKSNIPDSTSFVKLIDESSERGTSAIRDYACLMVPIDHPAHKYLKLEAYISKYESEVLKCAKKNQPLLYGEVEETLKGVNTLHLNKTLQEIQNLEHSTLKEEYILIQKNLEKYKGAVKQEFTSKYQVFSPVLIEEFYNDLQSKLRENWQLVREDRFNTLQAMFEGFCEETLSKLETGELSLFDSQRLSVELRESIWHLLVCCVPVTPTAKYYSKLEAVFGFLNLEESKKQEVLQSRIEPEASAEYFLRNSDCHDRMFSLISLVLVMSNTYQFFVPSSEHNLELVYSAWEREWLRKVIETAFEKRYEDLLGISKSKTEWIFVLKTEQHIGNALKTKGNWVTDQDVLDLTKEAVELDLVSKDEEKEANQKTKKLISRVSEYSQNPNRNKTIKKFLDFSVKVADKFSEEKPAKVTRLTLECINPKPSIHITIAVSGWLSQEDEMGQEWRHLSGYMHQGTTYALRWDASSPDLLKKDFYTITKGYLISRIHPALAALHLYKSIKNDPFKESAKQAEVTGKTLANLIHSRALGCRSVSFIAFSLGTRVVYYCLRELWKLGSEMVHDVVLLGGACPVNPKYWRRCRELAKGRVINTYCKTDKVLSVLYGLSKLEKAIGSKNIEVEGIENYDVTELASGHLKYRDSLDKILDRINFNL